MCVNIVSWFDSSAVQGTRGDQDGKEKKNVTTTDIKEAPRKVSGLGWLSSKYCRSGEKQILILLMNVIITGISKWRHM